MRTGIVGAGSSIAKRFAEISGGEILEGRFGGIPTDLDRYLICTGFLAGRALEQMGDEDLERTWRLNFVEPARFCEYVFARNHRARICLIGSESGFAGSYDMAYAGAKAALHLYVQRKPLPGRDQMLVAVAPHIIWDSRMTQCRPDLSELSLRAAGTRLGRWLEAEEVARAALALLESSPAISGTVLRMGTD